MPEYILSEDTTSYVLQEDDESKVLLERAGDEPTLNPEDYNSNTAGIIRVLQDAGYGLPGEAYDPNFAGIVRCIQGISSTAFNSYDNNWSGILKAFQSLGIGAGKQYDASISGVIRAIQNLEPSQQSAYDYNYSGWVKAIAGTSSGNNGGGENPPPQTFNSEISFLSTSPAPIAGVRATSNQSSPVMKFRFTSIDSLIGLPSTMTIYVDGQERLMLDFFSDYLGQPFGFIDLDGSPYSGVFTFPSVNF